MKYHMNNSEIIERVQIALEKAKERALKPKEIAKQKAKSKEQIKVGFFLSLRVKNQSITKDSSNI